MKENVTNSFDMIHHDLMLLLLLLLLLLLFLFFFDSLILHYNYSSFL